MTPITLGAWNVRTLMDNPSANRPERRTALVARELARYKIDIAALSETRLANEGQLTEVGGGYTFFWSGRSEEERREAGVGFAIKNHLVRNLTKLPKGVNDRLMTLQMPLNGKRHATLISAYAPTMTNADETKDRFYSELDETLSSVPKNDKLILLGDFNARVGCDSSSWEGAIGKNGVGKINSNGQLLLQTCVTHDLLITNTVFQLPTRQKTSWMHPRSKHWHLIDYIIVRRKDRQDVKVTKAMCGADCWTDHRLIISKMKLTIKPVRRPQGKAPLKRINVAKLGNSITTNALVDKLSETLETFEIQNEAEQDWSTFSTTVHTSSLEVLGKTSRKNQDWFDENDEKIKAILDEKNQLHRRHQEDPNSTAKKDAFTGARNGVQKTLREIENQWLNKKADEIQGFVNCHNDKELFASINMVYGPQHSTSPPLLSADGKTLITDRKEILDRWAEHFDSVLNRPSEVNDEAIDRMPQVPINLTMEATPSEDDVQKAINQLSNGKAPGTDGIPAEIYKKGGPVLRTQLTKLYESFWNKEDMPQELKDASIVHLYKRKGNRQSCDNHRGISLLSIAGKILARVLLNRLNAHLETGLLPETQCGFRKGRGTVDMIFAARQLQEKCREQNRELYTTFVDLTKAFDTVSRQGLWRIMAKFGCPDRFISMVRLLHDGMMARVVNDGDMSEPFAVSNGVKQGCVLAPTLFSMVFSAMLTDAYNDNDPGIDLKYRTDQNLYKKGRLAAPTLVTHTTLRDFLFADDCALNAGSESEMQTSMDQFASACNNFGLTISTKKTEVMHQPAPNAPYSEPKITVDGQQLQAVDQFTYLGSTLSREVVIDTEVNQRIAKASSAFGRLRKNVWDRRGISKNTKLKIYKAIVLPALLYACQSWTVYVRHAKLLNRCHLNCLRKILRIHWRDMVPDTEVLSRSNQTTVHTMLLGAQTRWAGHVSRMPDSRLPKQLLYGELSTGHRARGRPKKRFKDSLKSSLNELEIDANSFEMLAQDRSSWRGRIKSGCKTAEEKRTAAAQEKRALRKERANSRSTPTNPTLTCTICARTFRAPIGLRSHMRTHKNPT